MSRVNTFNKLLADDYNNNGSIQTRARALDNHLLYVRSKTRDCLARPVDCLLSDSLRVCLVAILAVCHVYTMVYT